MLLLLSGRVLRDTCMYPQRLPIVCIILYNCIIVIIIYVYAVNTFDKLINQSNLISIKT